MGALEPPPKAFSMWRRGLGVGSFGQVDGHQGFRRCWGARDFLRREGPRQARR